MSILMLTASGFVNEDIKQNVLNLCNKDVNSLTVAIVTSASPKKEQNQYAQKAKGEFLEMGFKDVVFIDFEFDSPQTLITFDVIYFNGGNPFQLLYHTKKSGADNIIREILKEDKLIIGVSAGSVLFGPHLKLIQFFTPKMNTYELDSLDALAITKHIIFPHYNREELFIHKDGLSIEDRIKQFERDEQCNVTRLNDDKYIVMHIN